MKLKTATKEQLEKKLNRVAKRRPRTIGNCRIVQYIKHQLKKR